LWGNAFFWAGIVALLFLGVSEVVSHRYSERKDELVSQQQVAADRRHDEEMARVQLLTAQANERAAALEKEAETARGQIAGATKAAATANEHAAGANERAANLEKEAAAANERAASIMKATAWRAFLPDQVATLERELAKHPGKIILAWIANDSESLALAVQFSKVLETAHWQLDPSSRTYSTRLIWGITIPDSGPVELVSALRSAFTAAHITFSTEAVPLPNMSFGSMGASDPEAVTILFGSKLPTFTQPPF
jgi:hypothetical protein